MNIRICHLGEKRTNFLSELCTEVRLSCKAFFYMTTYCKEIILDCYNLRYLTEHPFTDRSALYRIPLELVKNRKLHNEMLFF